MESLEVHLTQGIFKVGDEDEIKPGILNEKKKSYEPIQTEIVYHWERGPE